MRAPTACCGGSRLARVLGCQLALLGAAGLSACGVGPFTDEPGGAANLPTRAAGPYHPIPLDLATPADEPYLVSDRAAELGDPAPLALEGGGLRVWFTRTPTDGSPPAIWSADVPSVTDLPDRGPALALAADAAWEEGSVSQPSVIDLGGGHLALYYQGGTADPGIGRADSTDGGETWTKHPENPLIPGAEQPGAALLPDGSVVVYFARAVSPTATAIFVARSSDGVGFEVNAKPVVAPRPDTAGAFDSLAVGDPFALVTPTLDPGGEQPIQIGLFFTGTGPDPDDPGMPHTAIGYAGSYGGQAFDRFFGPDPVLDGGPTSTAAPAVLSTPVSGTMLFVEPKQGRLAIAVAVTP